MENTGREAMRESGHPRLTLRLDRQSASLLSGLILRDLDIGLI
jgi:hypothetical protein